MGGWGINGMSDWVRQEGYGCLWVSTSQYLCPCLPRKSLEAPTFRYLLI